MKHKPPFIHPTFRCIHFGWNLFRNSLVHHELLCGIFLTGWSRDGAISADIHSINWFEGLPLPDDAMFLSLRILILIPTYYKSRDKHRDKIIA